MSDRYLLPSNATEQEVSMSASVARVSDVPVPIRDLYNADKCPDAMLPWLAWSFSLDEWNPAWSVAQKRQSVKNSVYIHRHKGTIGAVKRALAALGVGVQVQEWFRQIPAGTPFTYRLLLDVTQTGVSQAEMVGVQDVASAAKNVRSHLDKIRVSVTTRARPRLGGVAGVGSEITVKYGGATLRLDGTWMLDGKQKLNSFKKTT